MCIMPDIPVDKEDAPHCACLRIKQPILGFVLSSCRVVMDTGGVFFFFLRHREFAGILRGF